MPRSYRHLKELEPEILKMREEGKSKREIAKYSGLRKKQITRFVTHYRKKRKKQ